MTSHNTQFRPARFSRAFNFFNGRGKMETYVFREKLKISDIVVSCLSENDCRRAIIDFLHPGGPGCPRCGAKLSEERHERFYRNHISFCSSCKKKFFATTGTFASSAKIRFKEIIFLFLLIDLGIRYSEILRHLPRCKDTLNRWKKKYEESCFEPKRR